MYNYPVENEPEHYGSCYSCALFDGCIVRIDIAYALRYDRKITRGDSPHPYEQVFESLAALCSRYEYNCA